MELLARLWKFQRDREARAAGVCCHMMRIHSAKCPEHDGTAYWCPDQIVQWWEDGHVVIPISPDGGGGGITIRYCPWCGERVG